MPGVLGREQAPLLFFLELFSCLTTHPLRPPLPRRAPMVWPRPDGPSTLQFCFLLSLVSIPAGLLDVAFAAADADGSGTIDVGELDRLVKVHYYHCMGTAIDVVVHTSVKDTQGEETFLPPG